MKTNLNLIGGMFVKYGKCFAQLCRRLGFENEAWELYKKISPAYIEDISEIHRTEPYVYSQMIAGIDSPRFGEAKNSWLTGTSAWTFISISQAILGIKPDYDGLRIEPCLPDCIDTYIVHRRFRGTMLDIEVKKTMQTDSCAHNSQQEKTILVDGRPIEGTLVKVKPNSGRIKVEVYL